MEVNCMGLLDFILNIFKNNKKNAKIITKNLSKTFGEKDPLEVGLYAENNIPIVDKNLTIESNEGLIKEEERE